MKIMVEATACDLDKEMPTKTFVIKVDGEEHELDLCKTHGQLIEDLIEEAKRKREEAEASAPKAPAPRKAASAPAKKTAAKKTAAKKTSAPAKKASTNRRRPKVVSLEEIEKQKQGAGAEQGAGTEPDPEEARRQAARRAAP